MIICYSLGNLLKIWEQKKLYIILNKVFIYITINMLNYIIKNRIKYELLFIIQSKIV